MSPVSSTTSDLGVPRYGTAVQPQGDEQDAERAGQKRPSALSLGPRKRP